MPDPKTKEQLDDLEEKLDSAREIASRPGATERDKSDLKLIEQEYLGAKQKARHTKAAVPERKPERGNLAEKVDRKLDAALKESFPGSDPVSFVQAAPLKKEDRELPTVKAARQASARTPSDDKSS